MSQQKNTQRSTAVQPLSHSNLESVTGGRSAAGGQGANLPTSAGNISMPDLRFSLPDLRGFYVGWPGEIG